MLENKEASNKSEEQNPRKEPGKPNKTTNLRIEEDEYEILLVEEEEQEEEEINAETVRNVFSQNKKNGYVKTSLLQYLLQKRLKKNPSIVNNVTSRH